MKKLDSFLIKSYLGPFVLTFFISLFVLLMQFLWKYIDDFVGKGFDIQVIAELMFYASATFVPMALPLAILLSSLMNFGNLGENYELAAIKSTGISLWRVMKPLIIVVVIISIGAFYFSNNILPIANLKFRTLLRDVRQQKPAVQIDEGIFYSEIDNYVIKIGKKDPDGISIYDVLLYDHTPSNGNTNVTIAKEGKMEMTENKKYLVFTLFNGYSYDENIQKGKVNRYRTHPLQKIKFEKEIRRIELSAFDFKKSDAAMFRNNYEMMNIRQLAYYRDSLIHNRDTFRMDFDNYCQKDFGFFHTIYVEGDSIATDTTPTQFSSTTTLDNKVSKIEAKGRQIISDKIKKSGNIIHKKTNSKPKYDSAFMAKVNAIYDTSKVWNDTLLLNFKYSEAIRIINNALVASRNASYHSDVVHQNLLGKTRLIAKHEIEWNRKFTLSLACLLFFFIGAPLGAIIRKGGLGTPLVLSILLFVVYYIFAIVGEKAAKELVLNPFFGMWLSSLIYLPLGLFLTQRATSDAPLLDREAYLRLYNKITKYIPSFSKWLKS